MINNKEEKQHTDNQLGELRLCFRLLIHFSNNNKIKMFFGGQKYVGYIIDSYGENHRLYCK